MYIVLSVLYLKNIYIYIFFLSTLYLKKYSNKCSTCSTQHCCSLLIPDSLEKEHSLWSTGVNYISSFGGWLTWSKAQEKSVKSTEQEKSPSAEESSEGAHFSSVINKYV